MNGLTHVLNDLKPHFEGKFLITEEVKYEVIDKPIQIKRFELEAVRIQQLLDENILETPASLGVDNKKVREETEKLKNLANSTFLSRNREIKLIDSGESSCLALSKLLDLKKIPNLVAVDERTLRMLGEDPDDLKKLMESRLHSKLNTRKENYKEFQNFKFIRSSELIYIAYKKGLIRIKKGPVLDALLYALKFKGCAISGEEIEEIKKLG
jgi:predicted nucleic acid-binding protein